MLQTGITVTTGVWLSIGMGVGLGVLYGTGSYLFNRRALGAGRERFLKLVFGGLAVRMLVALVAMLLILVVIPVREGVFVGSFFAVVVLVFSIEIYRLHRGRQPVRPDGE